MKRLILTILYLLLSVPCFAQEKLAWMGAVGVGSGVGAVDGPNTWYYGGGGNDDSYSSYEILPSTEVDCNDVTVAASGTVTKLSIRDNTGSGITKVKIAIYNTSGNILSDGCSLADTNAGWNDCTLGSPYIISAGTYRLCRISDSNQPVNYNASGGVCKYVSSKTYDDFPYSTLTYKNCGDTDKSYGLKIYVD